MKIGTVKKAMEIPQGRNMQLFEGKDDIVWAMGKLDSYIPDFTPDNVTGIIIFGNEDSPDQIWATKFDPANHLETEYTLIFDSKQLTYTFMIAHSVVTDSEEEAREQLQLFIDANNKEINDGSWWEISSIE